MRQSFHNAYAEEFRSLYELIDRKHDDPDIAYFSNMTFHYELAKLSGNGTIVSYIERLHGLMIRGEQAPIYRGSAYLDEMLPQKIDVKNTADDAFAEKERHRRIVDALVERKLEDAIRYLCQDIYPNIPFD